MNDPRGAVNFPDWKRAKKGDRVRHVVTAFTGSIAHVYETHLTIDWDDVGFGVSRGRVVSPAYDLERLKTPSA